QDRVVRSGGSSNKGNSGRGATASETSHWRISQTEGWLTMNRTLIGALFLATCVCESAHGDGTVVFSGQKKRNNLVSELLEVAAISKSGNSFKFRRLSEGWIFLSAAYKGKGKLRILLDNASGGTPVVLHAADSAAGRSSVAEAVRRVAKGEHKIRVDCEG